MDILLIFLFVSCVNAITVRRAEEDLCVTGICPQEKPLCAIYMGQKGEPFCLKVNTFNGSRLVDFRPHQHGFVKLYEVKHIWVLEGIKGWIDYDLIEVFRWKEEFRGRLFLIQTIQKTFLIKYFGVDASYNLISTTPSPTTSPTTTSTTTPTTTSTTTSTTTNTPSPTTNTPSPTTSSITTSTTTSATTPATTPAASISITTIVLITLSALLFLIVVGVVCRCFYKKRRQQTKVQGEEKGEEEEPNEQRCNHGYELEDIPEDIVSINSETPLPLE